MEIHSLDDIERLREGVRSAAQRARENLSALSADSMQALYTLKFEQHGRHPLEDRPLNLVEQLNQTATIMASLAAAERLLQWFPACGGFCLNPGTKRGRDISSILPGLIEAEVFAAVEPNNNKKLYIDSERLSESTAENRYVFFYSPGYEPGLRNDLQRHPGVQVWVLGQGDIM